VTGQPFHILLIEDSPTQAERFRQLFESEGWAVTSSLSAEAALAELNRAQPDLIVVDYYLPGMKGDEFCRTIRMNVNTRGIPILMLTVQGTGDAETRGLESGADDYLAKSADSDVLVVRAHALLRKSEGPAAILDRHDNLFSKAKLLAIDDSPTYLHYLAQELSGESYIVEKAQGGREGLERIENEAFDCVLVDLEMPGMDGIDVCRRAADMRRSTRSSMAIVMLTGHEEKKYMTRGLEAGADDFVGKSSDMAVLKARIRALLRRKFLMEENRGILEEFRRKEIAKERALAAKEAAEERARMAEKLAQASQELEKTNAKLRQALEVTKAITDHAADGLFMMDAQGRVTFMNPAAARIFGFAEEELLGQVLHDKIHHHRPDGTPYARTDCPLSRVFTNPLGVTPLDDIFFRKDGSPVDVACSNAPIVQDGRLAAAVLVVRDVSERKRAEERLRQAQKLESIGLLAGGIAHDFNNILTAIMGAAALLEDDVPPAAAGYIRSIVSGTEKGANLTRQLLDYAGKGQALVEDLDVPAVAREMENLMRLSLPKEISLEFDLPAGLPLIKADPGQIQQVLMNLVINAGEAVDPARGGSVFVTAGTENVGEAFLDDAGTEIAAGRYVSLKVTDNGCGMDEPTKAKVLDPFFTTKFTGRGLGLAAVSGILRSLKGAILIASAPGRGTTFRVLFPAAPKRISAA
jgi:PAS domain S-box-containing protein